MNTDVPAKAMPLLLELKDALTQATDLQMSAMSPTLSPEVIGHHLKRALPSEKPPEAPKLSEERFYDTPIAGSYGGEIGVAVSSVSEDTVLVDEAIPIECGSDSLLLIYRKTATGWKRVLRWQALPNYKVVGDAIGDFVSVVQLSPTRFVIAHGAPWCTSRWSRFDADLVQSTSSTDLPQRIWHLQRSYVRDDYGFKLQKVPAGFEMRMEVGTIESEKMTRVGVFRYEPTGDEVRRVQPVALNGRDFVDEWLQAPWNEVQQWSGDKSSASNLKQSHQVNNPRLEKRSFRYGPVRSCSDGHSHFQVEMIREDESHETPLYFQIEQQKNGFLMRDISAQPAPACHGKDLMSK